MPSNLKDIAEKLNVSIATVSRVVNNKGNVKAETKEIINKALKELNYSPNQVARSLKKKSTNTIGIIVPDITELFFINVIKGVDNILNKHGYTIILCDTGEDPKKEELYIDLLIEKQIDGIILGTVLKKSSKIKKIFDNHTPILFIDNLPDIRNNYDSVVIDNVKASQIAVEHLIKLGHSRIGIITGKLDETTGYDRLAGYKRALKDYKLDIDDNIITAGDFKEESGYENMKKLLELNNRVTAVYVTSSKMTFGAVKAIKEKGLKIPQDIALVGFDIHDPSGLIVPSITTMVQPEEQIGRVAAELLIKRLHDKGETYNQKINLDPNILIKDSCGYSLLRK